MLYAAGNYWDGDSNGAAILNSTDGGEKWDLLWTYNSTNDNYYYFNSITSNGSELWAVGESGLIVKSDGPDSFTKINPITDLPLYDVFFSDEDHGWISGGYINWDEHQTILLKTTNGGSYWREINLETFQANDIFFVDSLIGWAVGEDTSNQGIILETGDGGEHWDVQVDGLSGDLSAIHFKDGYGWVVGRKGLVLRTEDGISWIDQSTGKTYPDKIELKQNYPNPFNPITSIKYTVRAFHETPQHVNLSIYNLLGQKVATLVNKKQSAGTYNVAWDATGFSSGLYLYKLKSDGFEKVRKLVLLK